MEENLHYAIVGKFSHGRLDIITLRKSILGQCGINHECMIDALETWYILIRLTSLEDYV